MCCDIKTIQFKETISEMPTYSYNGQEKAADSPFLILNSQRKSDVYSIEYY